MLVAFRISAVCLGLSLSLASSAQQKPSPLQPFLKEDAPILVLEHVRVIDGTGSAAQENMRIDIANGKITSVESTAAHRTYPDGAKVLDEMPVDVRADERPGRLRGHVDLGVGGKRRAESGEQAGRGAGSGAKEVSAVHYVMPC